MSEEKQFPMISSGVSYCLVVSLLYLFGFWATFDINILQYISISDVIKLGIYPVLIGASMNLIVVFIQPLIRGHFFEMDPAKVFINLDYRTTKWFSIVAGLLIFIFLAVWHNGFGFVLAGIFLAGIFSVNISDLTFLKSFIPNPVIRHFVFFGLLAVLFCSFGWGRQDAEKVLKSEGIKVVSTSIFKGKGTEAFRSKGLLEKQDNLKYVGAAGEFFFFLTLDNRETIIAKYDDLHFIDIKKIKDEPTLSKREPRQQ